MPLIAYGGDRTVRFTGSSHTERAVITKDPGTLDRLNRHLAAKIEEHTDEIEMVDADLDPGADTLVVSYGITAGAMQEAVRDLRRRGRPVSAVTVHSLWPVPEAALRRAMATARRVVVAELNLGQYRREIERLAGSRAVVGLHRVDGDLLTPEQFTEALA